MFFFNEKGNRGARIFFFFVVVFRSEGAINRAVQVRPAPAVLNVEPRPGIVRFHDAKRKPAIRHACHAAAASLPRLDRVTACAHRNRPRQRRTEFRLSRRYRRLRRDIFQPPGRHRVADREARVPCPAYSPTSFRGSAYTERTKHAACNRCGRRPHGNGQLSLLAKCK